MRVPYLDLRRQYNIIKEDINNAIQETINSCAFVAGKKVEQFEEHFAAYCNIKHVIGISSGTSALYVALKALGLGKGNIAVTVPFTFIATVEAITQTNARPVFVDIDEQSYNMSVDRLIEYIEHSCIWHANSNKLVDKASGLTVHTIIPVHLYGQMSDMDDIIEVAGKYGLFVLEDAAQAHGATYKNHRSGTIGHIGCFSFYPSKNLGAFGQGGCIVTNNDELAIKARQFINHGQTGKYDHAFEGWNFKMDGFQAAVLDVKLRHLDTWNIARKNNAQLYKKLLKNSHTIRLPNQMPDREHVYHLFTIRVRDRTSLEAHLNKAGIGFTIAYPIPLHMQSAYQYLGYEEGDFPNAEDCARGVLALPIFPELTNEEIKYVCDNLNTWIRSEN